MSACERGAVKGEREEEERERGVRGGGESERGVLGEGGEWSGDAGERGGGRNKVWVSEVSEGEGLREAGGERPSAPRGEGGR